MKKSVLSDTRISDTAVKFEHVTKTFEQWQRTGGMKNMLKNLVRPEKKTITALSDICFTVKKGDFVAYAGPNGAGKSTTIKLLAGMLLPVRGDIEALGLSPVRQRIALMKRTGILFGNRTELWWDHPVRTSFAWKREVWGIEKKNYDAMFELVVDLLDIAPLLNTFARELSLGQRMRCDLAMMLLHEPELVLLDEPTLGLDVLAKKQMIDFLKKLNREKGTTILVTSHDMDDLEQMARRILLIHEGRLAFDGDFDALRRSTGSVCRLAVQVGGGPPPALKAARLIRAEAGTCEYEFDKGKTPVRDILRQVSALDHISEFELKQAPIEDVIAGLYRQWKKV